MRRLKRKGLHKHKEPKSNRFGCGICYPPMRRLQRAARERLAREYEARAGG